MKAVLTDVMGDDLKIANAARASFGKKSDWVYPPNRTDTNTKMLAEKDAKLIRFLARGMKSDEMQKLLDAILELGESESATPIPNGTYEYQKARELLNYFRGKATHWVPFAHCYMTFEITMPIFVARQLIRHTVGVTISEQSRRYVDEDPEYWEPATNGGWRLRPAEDIKQGSSADALIGLSAEAAHTMLRAHHINCTNLYRYLVDSLKVAPEIARIVLPLSSYTDWTWTASLVTVARVCHQRLDQHAQKEIRELTSQIYGAALEKFPVGFKALMDFGTESMEV